MRKDLVPYYVSRAALSILLGLALWVTGEHAWQAVLLACLVLAAFLWAPRSGRYTVHPKLGVTALRRDERTSAINDKAARNAFVATMLGLAATGLTTAPSEALGLGTAAKIALCLGIAAYYLSDLWLRLAQR